MYKEKSQFQRGDGSCDCCCCCWEENWDVLDNGTFNGIRVRLGVEPVRARYVGGGGGGVEEFVLSGAMSVCAVGWFGPCCCIIVGCRGRVAVV